MNAPDERSPIEDYLDELVVALAGRPPRELRGLIAEADAHLHDAAAAAMARGLPQHEAELEAVTRFGPAAPVAAAERDRGRPPVRVVLADLLRSAVLLAGLGAVAVGLSGAVAAVIRAIGGSRALVDVEPGRTLSAADCARWLALRPGAESCRAAAIADWADETVYYRLAVGVLGVLLLLTYRRLRRGHEPARAIVVVRDAVAHTAFALAAVWTLAAGIGALNGGGAGQWLSAAPVAFAGAAVFALLLLRDVRRATPG